MLAVKLDRVKQIIEKYEAGEREAVSTYTITNSARSASYTLVILRKEALKKEYVGMASENRRLGELHDKDTRIRQHYVLHCHGRGLDRRGSPPRSQVLQEALGH